MPRREKRGTGITAGEVLVFDLQDTGDLAAWFSVQVPHADWLDSMEHNARGFLQGCGMSPDQPWRQLMEGFNLEDDTLPIYAGRILEDIKIIRAAVKLGDAMEAAHVGVRLGQTLNECIMKSRYEKVALHGEKIGERARANAAQNRKKLKFKADAWHRRARAEANLIREEHPDWPTTQVAALVKKRLKLTAAARTVREVISQK